MSAQLPLFFLRKRRVGTEWSQETAVCDDNSYFIVIQILVSLFVHLFDFSPSSVILNEIVLLILRKLSNKLLRKVVFWTE